MTAMRPMRRPITSTVLLLWASGSVGLSGCKDVTGSQQLPAGTVDPAFYHTPAGALGLQAQALYVLENVLPHYVTTSGILTDELESNATRVSIAASLGAGLQDAWAVDARLLPEANYGISGNSVTDQDYTNLQLARADLMQASGAIAAYDTGTKAIGDPRHLRAELFALQGYTELLLADLYCSGVPLSTLDFQGDYTYHASSPTAQVYQDAVAQEDSALALADTSTRIQYLARALKGRALLALNDPVGAAQAVAPVPDDFQYRLAVNFHGSRTSTLSNQVNAIDYGNATVADTEGRNGLPYLSSGDPRTAVTVVYAPGAVTVGPSTDPFTNVIPLTFPMKYSTSGFSPFVVADGIEARLIQAEAALRAGDATAMITTLNQLRATAIVRGQTSQPPATLTDPGTDSARVALLFQERAYWLFLTGHRQGDLRRLLRQYSQWFHSDTQVYPSGVYRGAGAQTYGSDVTAPIPGAEDLNPLFHGCLDRNP